MAKVVIFGTGETAKIAYHYLKADSPHEIVAFTAHREWIKSNDFLGLPIIPFESVENVYNPSEFKMFVAMSYRDLNRVRARCCQAAKEKGYHLISYISSRSHVVGDVVCGDNCLILENQVIQPFAKIGNNVWIWGGVLIGHHSVIEDHCWLTSEAAIGGHAVIESYCFLGMNATVGHMVRVGRESFIGANTLVTKNIKGKSVCITKDTETYRLNSDQFLAITKMK